MKHKIKIIKQTRRDGSVFFLPYLIIYKYKFLGLYLCIEKHGIGIRIDIINKYMVMSSLFKYTYDFESFEEAKYETEKAVEEYFAKINFYKTIKEERVL